MPVELTCPYVAEWSSFSDEGKILEKTLGPEEILPCIVKGMTFLEIATELNAPLSAVTHVVAVIPDMMKWRDLVSGGGPSKNKELQMLQQIQRDYLPGEIEGEEG